MDHCAAASILRLGVRARNTDIKPTLAFIGTSHVSLELSTYPET